MQRLCLLATLALAVPQLAGCGGSSIRAPLEPVTDAVTARVGASPGEASVLGGSPGPFVPGIPRALRARGVSASVPPPLSAYVGVWSGHSIRQACSEAGGAVGVACRVLPRRHPVRIEIARDGADIRAVLSLGGQRAALVGRMRADGTLVLRGHGGSASHRITIDAWRTTLEQARINGVFSYVIAAKNEGLGSVTVVSALDGLALERGRPDAGFYATSGRAPGSGARGRFRPAAAVLPPIRSPCVAPVGAAPDRARRAPCRSPR